MTFSFYPTIIDSFRGELELSLRDDYFNLYFTETMLQK